MSTYIFERAPHRFGGQQQAFVDASNAIVQNAANLFRNAISSNQDLIQLFFNTLASFGADRKSIAVDHGTPGAKDFGVRRDSDAEEWRGGWLYNYFSPFAMTRLSGPYSEYNARLVSQIQKQLKTMEYDKAEFKQTKSQVNFDPCLGRDSIAEYSILTREINDWEKFFFTEKDYQRIYELCEVAPTGDSIEPLLRNKDAMQKLWEKSPEYYRRIKLLTSKNDLKHTFPKERKSDWIHVAVRTQLNGKLRVFSEYLTWAYRDLVNDPVDKMMGRSIIAILHQDPFLIDMMLDDMSKIFKTTIEWNGKNLKDLKDQVALFRYEFSHAMPFRRGSSAVAEWFERALYAFHGMKVAYNPDKLVDLEALTSSLKEFVDNYDSMIKLTKLEENPSEPRVEL